MAQLFSNNASSLLDATITDSATTVTVSSGDGAEFQAPTGGDFELITVVEGLNIEIMKVTARTTDSLTVVRGQEGTTPFAFTAGATIEGRLTAASLDSLKAGAAGVFGILGAISESVHAMTSALVDKANGNWQTRTLAGAETLTFDLDAGQGVFVTVVPGANVLTLSNVSEWVGGSAPATIEAEHAFLFWSDDGVTITGQSIGGIS